MARQGRTTLAEDLIMAPWWYFSVIDIRADQASPISRDAATTQRKARQCKSFFAFIPKAFSGSKVSRRVVA